MENKSVGYAIGILLGCILALGVMIYGFLVMFGVLAIPSTHFLAGILILIWVDIYGFRLSTNMKLDEIKETLKKGK